MRARFTRVRELETDRLLLLRWTTSDSDVDFLYDLYAREEVQRYLGTTPRVMQHRSEAVERAARLASFGLASSVHGMWAITQRGPDGRRLGVLLLKDLPASGDAAPLPPSGETEIGWHLHPDAWGQGYGREAAARVLAYALDEGLPRVLAVTWPENVASQRLALAIGMRHLGQTTRYYNATCELFEATAAPRG